METAMRTVPVNSKGVRVAALISRGLRVRLFERLMEDQTTISRVIQVCLQAYIDGAIPEEYMKQIIGYRRSIAPVNVLRAHQSRMR